VQLLAGLLSPRIGGERRASQMTHNVDRVPYRGHPLLSPSNSLLSIAATDAHRVSCFACTSERSTSCLCRTTSVTCPGKLTVERSLETPSRARSVSSVVIAANAPTCCANRATRSLYFSCRNEGCCGRRCSLADPFVVTQGH
jgi:hypothetical protein